MTDPLGSLPIAKRLDNLMTAPLKRSYAEISNPPTSNGAFAAAAAAAIPIVSQQQQQQQQPPVVSPPPEFKLGTFSAEEDQKILDAVKEFGTDSWQRVLQHTGLNRSKKQVQQRYHRVLKQSGVETSTSSTATANVVAPPDDHDSVDGVWRARLAAALRRCAAAEQQLARVSLQQQSARLGHVTYERHGASFTEMWQDGDAFLQLRSAAAELERTKEKWDARRKAAKRSAANFAEEDELCKVRLAACKRDEQLLGERLAALENEKQQHIRALRRLADEDASQFNAHPTLRDGRYLLLRLLGRGGFSEVYHAYDLHEHRDVAVKIHQLNSAWPRAKKENYTKHACREYNIQRQLVHERIVRLFDVFEIDANSFATVLEFCGGDDLDAQLRRHGQLPEREARLIVQQMLAGLCYLADQPRPVIHYDLKPANILFDVDGNAKIADFGLSKELDETERSIELTSQGAGTYWYLPPECFTEQQGAKITLKVDVWSVGVILFQMLYGQKPFGHGLSQQNILANNVIQRAQKVVFPTKPPVTAACKDFITLLLSHNPNERPSVHEAAANAYLKDM